MFKGSKHNIYDEINECKKEFENKNKEKIKLKINILDMLLLINNKKELKTQTEYLNKIIRI